MLTVLVDYDSGNLHSAAKAFQRMADETDAGQVIVSSRPEDVARAALDLAVTWGWIERPETAMALVERVAAMLWRMSHPATRTA